MPNDDFIRKHKKQQDMVNNPPHYNRHGVEYTGD